VYGSSNTGTGVYGTGYSNGVYGNGSGPGGSGVYGAGYSCGVYGTATHIGQGVCGANTASTGIGVYGLDSGKPGTAVEAYSYYGVGVYTAGPVALVANGVTAFSRSGVATVAGTSSKKKQSVEVTEVALTSASMVLATPQGKVSGVAVEGVVTDTSTNSFTIYLTKEIEVSLTIAWFVIDLFSDVAGPDAARKPPTLPTAPQSIPKRTRQER